MLTYHFQLTDFFGYMTGNNNDSADSEGMDSKSHVEFRSFRTAEARVTAMRPPVLWGSQKEMKVLEGLLSCVLSLVLRRAGMTTCQPRDILRTQMVHMLMLN